jgi:hypothetical protein
MNNKWKYFMITIVFFFACKKTLETNGSKSKVDTISLEAKTKETIDVNFDSFISKFIKDKQFRATRLSNPLYMYQLDESEINSENFIKIKIGIEEILLEQKDWKEKIILSHEKVKQDTTITHLEGDDTGLQMQYMFIKKDNKWYLDRITDYSM